MSLLPREDITSSTIIKHLATNEMLVFLCSTRLEGATQFWFMSSKKRNSLIHSLNGNMMNAPNASDEPDAWTTFLDQWKDLGSDLNSVVDVVDEELAEDTEAMPIDPTFGFTTAEILDVLGTGMQFEGKRMKIDLKFKSLAHSSIPKGRRKFENVLPSSINPSFEVNKPIKIEDGQDGYIYMTQENKKMLVGKNNMGTPYPEQILIITDPIAVAERYSETTKAKATALGYSNLIHSAACLMIAPFNSILEPIEGVDIQTAEHSIEMAGTNWQTRTSTADFIFGKYQLLNSLNIPIESREKLDISFYEDNYDTSYFLNSAMDQRRSPYSDVIDRLHVQTRDLTEMQLDRIAECTKSYISNLRPDTTTEVKDEILDDSKLVSVIKTFAKNITGQGLRLPAPYRIEPDMLSIPETDFSYTIRPYTGVESISTTFHTLPIDSDPTAALLQTIETTYRPSAPTAFEFTNALYNYLIRFRFFASIMVEAELQSKIHGSSGQFYSKYSRVGIAWKRYSAGSTTYYICYYRFSKPSIDNGIYQEIKTKISNLERTIYISPTFKSAITDINFTLILPHRLMSTLNSIFAYTNPNNRPFITQSIIRIFATCRWSSWQTSALAGDMRFLTLCLLANSGHRQAMIDKIATRVTKYLSFPDYYFIHLIIRMCNKGINRRLTPLLNMPMRFLSLEKDIATLHMWHIRGANHDSNCYMKLLKGVAEEIAERDQRVQALVLQSQFLDNVANAGVNQGQFISVMNSMPKGITYYNHILFLGLAVISSKLLRAGRRQEPTKLCLENLITDHNATKMSTRTIIKDETIISASKVADGFSDVLKEYNNPIGIYSLLSNMANGDTITNVYAIHSKDSKSKDREIPQMTNYMRPIQFVSETLISIYTDEESVDMMQDPAKYSKYVSQFSKIMRDGGLTRSEDKSFFCGHLQPESMSLGTLAVARATGSAALTTAAALQRINRSRWTVSPLNCNLDIIKHGNEEITIKRKDGNKTKKCIASLNYYHMMQGVYAMGGALINTVFVSGLDLISKEILPDIEYTSVMTTSDDSARGVVVSNKTKFRTEDVANAYMNLGTQLAPAFMMQDSIDKAICSDVQSEFNNVVAMPNGMLPQSFVHASLCVQPLIGISIVDDIVSAVSNARMSLTWGDSIDLTRSAYVSYITLIQQKWLLTESEIEFLQEAGILPSTDEDLLKGFHVKSDLALKNLFSLVKPDLRQSVIEGQLSILKGVRSFNIAKTRNRKPHLINYDGPNRRIKSRFESINTARKLQNRKNQKYYYPVAPSKRQIAKDKFIDAMTNLNPPDVDAQIMLKLQHYFGSFDVNITPRPPTAKDYFPATVGRTVRTQPSLNFPNIRSWKHFGIYSERKLVADEMEAAAKTDDEIDKLELLETRREFIEGFSWKSPSGYPLMRSWNNLFFHQPMVFDFESNLPDPIFKENTISIGKNTFDKVEPTWISDAFLKKLSEFGQIKIALALLTNNNGQFVLYKTDDGQLLSKTAKYNRDDINKQFPYTEDRNYSYMTTRQKAISPLSILKHNIIIKTDFVSTITGDVEAVVNYGNYINSNALRNESWLSNIYRKYKSNYDKRIHKFRVEYPYFHKNCLTFEAGAVTSFVGHRSSCKVRLQYVSLPKPKVMINCTLIDPFLIEETNDDDEECEYDE